MDPRDNPYAPGAGLQPPELAGRGEIIEQIDVLFDRLLRGRPVRGMLLLGLRGVGKTVLLASMMRAAEDRRIKTVFIESPESGRLAKMLAAELRKTLYAFDAKQAMGPALRRAMTGLGNFIRAFKLSYGDATLGFDLAPGLADSGDLEQDLPDLIVAVAEAAAERESHVCIGIDEIQYLSESEFAALLTAAHKVAQRGLPLVCVGAGLPQSAALAGNAKSYAERLFVYPEIGALDKAAADAALRVPALELGVAYTADAINAVLHHSGRHPYFLQLWGALLWDAAQAPEIGLADVRRAEPKIVEHLDRNFFRVRYDRLTALQQKYLRAMAELGVEPYKTGEIAATLGVDARTVGMTRDQLIKKGMIYAPRYGETAFTVPLFDAFMRRQIPILETHVPKRRPGRRASA